MIKDRKYTMTLKPFKQADGSLICNGYVNIDGKITFLQKVYRNGNFIITAIFKDKR